MNIKSNEKKENSTVELVIGISAEEFDAAINKIYNKEKKNIALPGFRKGKASRKMIEAMFGEDVFYEDALDELCPGALSDALQEAQIEPVAFPDLEVLEAGTDGVSLKAVITVKPDVIVRDYKGMTAVKSEVTVTPEDVKEEMQKYIDRVSSLVSVDRPAKTGDTVVIDYEGFRDGAAFEGGKDENYSLELGSGVFVPGFEEQLIGVTAGEERDLDITFAEDYYSEELANASVVFKVKVHEVKERQEPELDDEFAKDVSEYDTLEEFEKSLTEEIRVKHQEQADQNFENLLIQKLTENMECDIPDKMIEARTQEWYDNYVSSIERQGIPVQNYLDMMNMTQADLYSRARESAESNLKVELALEAVADAENIEVSDEEIEAEINKMAEEYNMEPDDVRAAVEEKVLRNDLRSRKTVDLIVSSAQVETLETAECSEGTDDSQDSEDQQDLPSETESEPEKTCNEPASEDSEENG